VSLASRLRSGLARTREVLETPLEDLARGRRPLDGGALEEVEQALVGAEQRLLDLFQCLGVERAAAARQVLKRRLQHLARAGEPAAQAVEERH